MSVTIHAVFIKSFGFMSKAIVPGWVVTRNTLTHEILRVEFADEVARHD
jgi:hypothetical protein